MTSPRLPIHAGKLGQRVPEYLIAAMLALTLFLPAQTLAATNPPRTSIARHTPASIQVQKDTLVVGSEQDFPPFALGMTDQEAGGFTVDLWKAVAAEAGLDYTIRVLPFSHILQEFREGRIDVLINLAYSDERHKFADFTVPHVVVHGAIFVRKGNKGIRSEEDLTGKSIIVLNGDLAHDYALSQGWQKQLKLVDTAAEGLRLLASGKHDAMLLSKLAGMQTLHALGLSNIEPLKAKAGFSQKFSFAVQEGQSELLGKINEAMAITKSNGTYDALYDKWFGLYEDKEIGLRQLLNYIIPIVAIFLAWAGYFFYRRQLEREAAEKKYRDLYDHAPDMFLSIAANTGTVIDCNQTLLDTTGYSRQEIIGSPVIDLYQQECADISRAAFKKFLTEKEVHGVELKLRRKDGSSVDVSLNATAVCDKHGNIMHSRSALRDITERKQAELALKRESEKNIAFLRNASDGIHILDTAGNVIEASDSFCDMLGYRREEMIGMNVRQWDVNFSEPAVTEMIQQQFKSRTRMQFETRHRRKDGTILDVEVSGFPLELEGIPVLFNSSRDITERKAMELKVQHLAHFDPLTDLPNRTLLTDRLQQSLAIAKRDKSRLALLFIDLDKFKPINDTLGHNIGDLLLKEVAQRIKACLRESDTVARIGGDEFVVLLPAIENNEDALAVAEKIRNSLNHPFAVHGHDLIISSSTGIAIYPEHGSEEKQLFNNADTAMYHAKESGRDNVKIFQSGMRSTSA